MCKYHPIKAAVGRAMVGPGGADSRLLLETLASLVRDLTAVLPEALTAAA